MIFAAFCHVDSNRQGAFFCDIYESLAFLCPEERKETEMISRIAIIGIIVEEKQSISKINTFLSDCRDSIVGRLGIPYDKRGINVISIVMDAPTDAINALTGKLAALPGVSAKAVFSRTEFSDEEI